MNTDGTGFWDMQNFTGSCCPIIAPAGANPAGTLILSAGTMYGTTVYGGGANHGTVFAINTDGTGFTTLYSFSPGPTLFNTVATNSDGAFPQTSLMLIGNTLYGTAQSGGSFGNGTLFAVNTDGTGFVTLHEFTPVHGAYYANGDGQSPSCGLILSGNTLYGACSQGGSWGNGTIFSLSFQPQLTITVSAAEAILAWPTNSGGFDYTGDTLQSNTNLGSSAVWTTVSPAPVIINGQNIVTNLISGTQKFFRLSQ